MGSPRWAVCAARLPSFRNFFTLMRVTRAACACPRPPPSRPAMWASRCGRRPLGRVHSVVRCRASRRLPQVLIYLFCLCDHLTEYFTNLKILLYMNIIFAAAARSRSSPQQQRRQQPTRRTAKYPQFPITKTGTNKFTVRVLLIDAGVEASKHGRAIAAILGPKGAKRRTSFFSSHFVTEYFTHFNINI